MATCLVELRASSSPEGRRLRSTTQQPTVPPGGLALAPWRPCGCPSHRGFRRGSSRRETLSPHTVLASSLASPSHQVTTLFPRGTSGNDIVPQERTMFPRKRLCSSGNDFISAAQLIVGRKQSRFLCCRKFKRIGPFTGTRANESRYPSKRSLGTTHQKH